MRFGNFVIRAAKSASADQPYAQGANLPSFTDNLCEHGYLTGGMGTSANSHQFVVYGTWQSMKFRNSAKLPKGQFVISEDLILWGAAAVMCYSIFVPLLALESLFLADTLLQFGMLHQTGMLILVVLASLLLFGRMITQGWRTRFWLLLLGSILLLGSLQPATACCGVLVAVIAGVLPLSELHPLDVVLHLLPIVGCILLMIDSATWRKFERGRLGGEQLSS
jgi:hypothetical protein